MAFLETPRFPDHISQGSAGGPMWSTAITTLSGGTEQRNQNWAYPKFKYDVSVGVKDLEDLYEIYAFHMAVGGAANGFRFKDFLDHSSAATFGVAATNLDQVLGTGDGVAMTYQLVKRYTKGALTLVRPIKKPVAGTVVVSVNGVAQGSGWSVDTTTGIVTFSSPPANGHVVRAGFQFDVPVRFESDEFAVSFPDSKYGSASIDLISLAYT